MKTKGRWTGKRVLTGLLVLVMVLNNLNGLTFVTEAEDVTTDTTEATTRNSISPTTEIWDFESVEQLDDFDLYASGTDSFSIKDGMLVPSGVNGEMKAILKGDVADVNQVSVDIIPGESGTINAGLYIGASDAGNAANTIDALAFLVESDFTGWNDAPNRIDIVTGTFPKWSAKQRIISQSGSGNAIYSGGTKGPINLCLDFDEDMVTITVSLVGNANKFVQTVYECNSEDLVGSVGIRANNDDMCFDNFSISYGREVSPKLQQGVEFNGHNVATAEVDSAVGTIPQTVEMWVKVNQDTAASRTALISAFTGTSVSASQVGDWALFTNENGELWWFEKTASGTVSVAKGTTIKTGDWVYVAITRETGIVKYYVNGSLVGTTESTSVVLNTVSATVPTLGFCSYDSNGAYPNYLDGAIGDVRLWSTTRTQAQIREDMYAEATGNETGLMNHWGLDEQVGTVFWDSASAQNNGSITTTVTNASGENVDGATWTKGSALNKGLEFATVGAKATLDKAIGMIPQTVEAWVKIDKDTAASRSAIISAFKGPYTADAQKGDWALFTDGNGKLWWYEKNASGQYSTAKGTSIKTGDWVHVAITRSEGTVKYYINGKEVASDTGNVVLNTESTKIPTLGYCEYGGENYNYLDGALGDVRLWSITRSQEEIQSSMYQELAGDEAGLTNYWTFDEQVGTVFRNKVEGGANGTLTGAEWNQALNSNTVGLTFDGTGLSSYAKTDAGLTAKPKTIEAWVKMNPIPTGKRQAIITNYEYGSLAAHDGKGYWGLYTQTDGRLWYTERSEKGNVSTATTGTYWTGEWMHVAAVRTDEAILIYVNGELVLSHSSNAGTTEYCVDSPMTIGYASVGSASLNGEIGEIRLWSEERTAEQIQGSMYTELEGIEEGLTNYWTFDEQVGTVFEDKVAGGIDGTLIGARWNQSSNLNLEEDVTSENKGYNFSLNKVWITENGQHVYSNHTVEAWVKIPKAIKTENVIAYNDMLTRFKFSITAGGAPQLYWKDEADKETKIIASNVDVRTSKWVHVAFVSDVAAQTVTCYVNGKNVHVVENVVLNDIFENEFVTRKVSLGNKFVGLMADFRLWTKPLSAEEVKSSMDTSYTQAVDGLVLNVPFDDASTTEFRDLSGKDNTIVEYVRRVDWTDDTTEPKDYSMVVIPDQQALSSRYPDVLDRMYQWIADNAEEENIKFAMNLGDITDYNTQEEWEYSLAALDKIDDLVPYSFVPGNHEYFIPERGSYSYAGYGYRNLTEMNKYFGNIYYNSPAYRETYDGGVENSWHEFEVNGHKYLILALEYCPRDSVLAWASEIVEAHPYHQVIVTTHSYVNTDGVRVATASDGFLYEDGKEGPNTGQQMWEKFASQHENIIMVLNGHIVSDAIVPRIDEGVHGNKVIQMLINGQGLDGTYRGVGLLAMLRFNAAGDEMELTYFSPGHGENGEDQIFNDTKYTFKLPTPVDMVSDKFTGMTLNLDGKIGFNFYINKDHKLGEDAYVRFKLPRATELGEEEPNKIGLTFDGTGLKSYAKTDKGIDTMPRTIEAWVKMNPLPEGEDKRQVIISNYTEGSLANAAKGTWGLYATDETYETGRLWWTEKVGNAGTEEFVTLATPKGTNYYNGEWMHVAVVRTTDGKLQFYVNGTLVSTQDRQYVGDETSKEDNPLNIGYLSITNGSLNGDIGEIRLWSTERTAEQIQGNMYQELAGNETGLTHYWTFDEQSGTVFKDKVVGGINGTLIGAKWNDGQIVRLADVGEATANGYKFQCLVPAKEMADGITATLYDSEGEIRDERTVSVRDYAEAIINNKNRLQSYAEVSPLMKSMLHYGARSQALFEYNTADPANKNLAEAEDKVSSVTIDDLQNYAVGYQGKTGFGRLSGATLVLKGETTLRMFFEFESGADLTDLKFTVAGIEQEVERAGKYYILNFKNIAAKSLDNSYTVQVSTSAGVQFSASCSAMTFCYNALNSSTDEALKDTSRALYLYNMRANRYMEEEAISVSEYYDELGGDVEIDELHGFTVTADGKLKPPSIVDNMNVLGQARVIHPKTEGEEYKSVSIDIYPNSENDIINAGIYLGVAEVDNAHDSISALAIMAESMMENKTRVDITIGSFYPWESLQRKSFTGDDSLFPDEKRKPINLKVDIGEKTSEGTPITVTLTLIDDPTKSVSTTYTYKGEYDLVNGQVGFRSHIEKSSFDNFKVETNNSTRTYTFDTEEETRAYGLAYYHSVWRGPVDAIADNTLAFHDSQTLEDGTLSTEIVGEGDKAAGIVFGADTTESNKVGLSFDGTGLNSYAKTDKGIATMPRTVEAWVKMKPLPEGTKQRQVIISNYTEGDLKSATKGTWGLYAQDDGTGRLWWTEKVGDAGSEKFVTLATPTGTNYYNGKWMHVAVVRTTDGKLQFYVNGTLVSTQDRQYVGDETSKADNPLNIGYLSITNGSLNGDIGEIRLWSEERNAEQIRGSMYTELAGTEEGLTNYWTFDEQSGTIFRDKVAGGIDGTLIGAKWNQANKVGLSFDGTTYAKTDKGLTSKPKTIEAWVKMNPSESRTRQPIITNYTGASLVAHGNSGYWGLYTNEDGYLWYTERSEKQNVSQTSVQCRTGEWMHVAIVRTDTAILFYVNGELVLTHANKGGASVTCVDSPMTIGYLSITKAYLDGEIGEIRLWSTERSAEQIQGSMYTELAGTEEGLTNYWTFDEQSGTVFRDKVAGGIDGTLIGAKWNQASGPNYYLYRMTKDYTNNLYNLQLVKVVDGTENVLATATLSQEEVLLGRNSLEVVRDGNRIYCYFNGSGNKRCYIYYEDKEMLSGTGIGLWAKTASDADKVHFQNIKCKRR